ncbi:hypothetical protein [Paraclostridium sordellii]|nr:hypothetical protein [Paeniclostridium sordellii]
MTDRMKEIDEELPGRYKDDVWLYVYKNGKEKYRNDLFQKEI